MRSTSVIVEVGPRAAELECFAGGDGRPRATDRASPTDAPCSGPPAPCTSEAPSSLSSIVLKTGSISSPAPTRVAEALEVVVVGSLTAVVNHRRSRALDPRASCRRTQCSTCWAPARPVVSLLVGGGSLNGDDAVRCQFPSTPLKRSISCLERNSPPTPADDELLRYSRYGTLRSQFATPPIGSRSVAAAGS